MKMESLNIFQMLGKNIYFYKMAGLLGASAVILGAYGAHGKENRKSLSITNILILCHFYNYIF